MTREWWIVTVHAQDGTVEDWGFSTLDAAVLWMSALTEDSPNGVILSCRDYDEYHKSAVL